MLNRERTTLEKRKKGNPRPSPSLPFPLFPGCSITLSLSHLRSLTYSLTPYSHSLTLSLTFALILP